METGGLIGLAVAGVSLLGSIVALFWKYISVKDDYAKVSADLQGLRRENKVLVAQVAGNEKGVYDAIQKAEFWREKFMSVANSEQYADAWNDPRMWRFSEEEGDGDPGDPN